VRTYRTICGAVAAVLCPCLFLSACTGQPGHRPGDTTCDGTIEGSNGAPPAYITVWSHTGQPGERQTLVRQVAAFNSAQSQVQVKLIDIPEAGYASQVRAAAATGDLPDLLDLDGPNLYNYAWSGELKPLASCVSTSLRADLLSSIVQQGTYAGRLWGLGTFDSGLGLYRFEGPPGSAAEALIQLGIRSAAGAPILVEDRLWGVMVAAWTRHQPASGIEHRIVQFTDLVATAISNAQARADLAASRARIVAASDQTRRRIERDLHDGAQQRLVSLGLALRAAQRAMPPGQAQLGQELARVADGITEVLEELRELSRGIHPAILSLGGLGTALKALARQSPVPVQLDVQVQARLPERAEVAVYFVVSEALANVAKHAQASWCRSGSQPGTASCTYRFTTTASAEPIRPAAPGSSA
jgi:signal transduction histidine kinase